MEIQTYRAVWMLRHGQESPDRTPPLGGHLTELGQRQAQLVAERLAGVPFDRIVASSLHRAADTAGIVASQQSSEIEVEFTEDLWECVPSIPPGQEVFFDRAIPERMTRCQESLNRAYTRFFETETRETLLLVCHGNVIRYLLCRMLGLPLDAWARFDLYNCSLARIEWKTVLGQQVIGFNDVGHLPLEMQTYG